MHKNFKGCFAFILLIFLGLNMNFQLIVAAPKEEKSAIDMKTDKSKEAFNPGDVIMEHVGDSYSWHIFSVKNFDLSVPLPVIVISKSSGFHVFSSSKVYEEGTSYLGFQIEREGDNKGKIVEVLSNGTKVRPMDISITKNVLSLFFSLGLMLWIFISIAKRYENNPNRAPKGIQSLLEPLIIFVRDDIGIPSLGKDRYEKYMPYLLTVFFFIFLNNLLGLIPLFPGGANVTGNIAITMVLALITFIITMVSTNKYFWFHLVNTPGVPWWL
jgi:F-type H+-transporting ATPase subunit a